MSNFIISSEESSEKFLSPAASLFLSLFRVCVQKNSFDHSICTVIYRKTFNGMKFQTLFRSLGCMETTRYKQIQIQLSAIQLNYYIIRLNNPSILYVFFAIQVNTAQSFDCFYVSQILIYLEEKEQQQIQKKN